MNTQEVMKNLLNEEKDVPRIPKAGDIVEGSVLKISKNAVLIELGALGTGIVYGGELKENRNLRKSLEVGNRVKALVLDPENDDGYVELSLQEATVKEAWKELKEKQKNNETVDVSVLQANRGGLVVENSGIVGFLPVSQLAPQNYPRVEGGDKNKILQFLNQFIGKEMQVKILDLDKKEEKFIVSEKAAEKKRMQETLSNYKKGDTVEGTVTAVADFGAFIKLDDNLEGLAHISELDWKMLDHPSQIVKKDQKIQAQITDIQNDQVSLSLKALKENPWEKVTDKYQNGQVVPGKVVRIGNRGALVEIDDKIYGQAPVSYENQLTIGETCDFEILSFAPKNHKITLSPKK